MEEEVRGEESIDLNGMDIPEDSAFVVLSESPIPDEAVITDGDCIRSHYD